MPCYRPLTAYRRSDRGIVFRDGPGVVSSLQLPCWQCVGCRLERSKAWAVRCVHEAQLHGELNSFVTLTLDDERLVEHGASLNYVWFQRFMYRVRSYARRRLRVQRLRFYMAGEYGEQEGRPHYHALLFGLRFPDLVYWSESPGGARLYRSETLEKLWPYGFCSVGEVTFESAAYVARYVMKKVNGSLAKEHYGERLSEFTHMSLRPGIGAGWLERFSRDVFPHGKVVVRGRELFAPRYYLSWFKSVDPDGYARLLESREVEGARSWCDRTPERQAVREKVAAARAAFFLRKL